MKKIAIPNARTYKKLNNNDGLTLKKGKPITYKTGYQVALRGIETTNINEIHKLVKGFSGNAGIWYSEGIYYIDYSIRVSTKAEALRLGRMHNQISVLKWSDMSLIYC